MKQIQIGKLVNTLAELEAWKGKRKLAEDGESKAKAEFVTAAGGENAEFISETGQKMVSVSYQSRTSFSKEALLLAGVTESQLAEASKVSVSPVVRVH